MNLWQTTRLSVNPDWWDQDHQQQKSRMAFNPEMRQSFNNEADAVQSANEAVQSAKSALYLLSKGQNCTLEEVAVLRVIQMKPKRVGSKRDGRWEIVTE